MLTDSVCTSVQLPPPLELVGSASLPFAALASDSVTTSVVCTVELLVAFHALDTVATLEMATSARGTPATEATLVRSESATPPAPASSDADGMPGRMMRTETTAKKRTTSGGGGG